MLASVLYSEKAIQVNIQIVRIFTKIREALTDNLSIKLEIEEIKKKLENQDKNIESVLALLLKQPGGKEHDAAENWQMGFLGSLINQNLLNII